MQHLLLRNIGLAVVYLVAAKLGLLFALVHGSVSLVWPPAGIAIASLVIWGIPVLPGVAIGAFAANVASGGSWLFPLVAALGNSGEALLGAVLLQRVLRFRCELMRVRDILGIPLFAAISATVAATAGASALWYGGGVGSSAFLRTWFHWWLGDTVGMIVVAPVVFTLKAYGVPKAVSASRAFEAAALMAALFLGGLALFGVVFPTWPALSILILPLLILVAFRFTLREVAFANMFVAIGAAIGAGRTFGMSHPDILARGLLTLSVLLLVSCLTTQLLGAILAQWRRTEKALRAERQQLRDIIEFLPDATFIVDQDKRVVAWNHAIEQMTGVKKDEVIGQADYAYAPPFFGERRPVLIDFLDVPSSSLETRYKFVKRVGETVIAESFIPRLNNGAGMHLRGVAAPLRDRQGRRFGAIECIRDVTEQKLVEQALREKEQKYRELVEHANSIILHWDSEGRITFLNEFGLRFFGYSQAEILGRHVVGTIVPETESSGRDLRPLMQRISADPVAFERNTNENMRRNGEKVWISWTNKVGFDSQGRVEGILSIGTDITEQRRAEAALRESESRYRGLFEDCPTSLWEEDFSDVKTYLDDLGRSGVTDIRAHFNEHPDSLRICAAKVKVLDVNRATLELLQYDKRADLCAHLSHVFRDESYRTFLEELACLASGNMVFQTEAVNCNRHGKVLHVNMNVAIVPGHEETWSRVFVAITDISSRVRAEEELHVLNEELETRVAERTTELALAKERAEAADRVKSAFLAAMSHELRTPLNSIIGFTGIILQGLPGPLNSEQEKQLKMVQGSARHLLALINDVLDLSKIEAGQLEVENEFFDARASIAKVLQLVTPLAENKGLALSSNVSPEIGELKNDCRRFEQILINLLNNGVKFTEKGSVRIECVIDGGELVTRVADTGIGIKQEDVGKLFHAFQQVDVGLARNHEGTGLGLSICKRLVEKMGGRIWVESEYGVGSVFTFTLPLVVD